MADSWRNVKTAGRARAPGWLPTPVGDVSHDQGRPSETPRSYPGPEELDGADPMVPGTGPSTEEWAPGRRAELATAGLIVVAGLAVLEGYRQLDVIPPAPRHPAAVVFAVIVLLAIVAFTRPRRGGHRVLVQRAALTAGACGAIASLAAAGDLGASAVLLGAIDMVIAALAVGSAVAGEWRSRRAQQEN